MKNFSLIESAGGQGQLDMEVFFMCSPIQERIWVSKKIYKERNIFGLKQAKNENMHGYVEIILQLNDMKCSCLFHFIMLFQIIMF